MHRRDFLNAGLGASLAALLPTSARTASAASRDVLATLPQRLCVFTDHVDDLGFSYADVAKQYGALGYGPDLTVRGGTSAAAEVSASSPDNISHNAGAADSLNGDAPAARSTAVVTSPR